MKEAGEFFKVDNPSHKHLICESYVKYDCVKKEFIW